MIFGEKNVYSLQSHLFEVSMMELCQSLDKCLSVERVKAETVDLVLYKFWVTAVVYGTHYGFSARHSFWNY